MKPVRLPIKVVPSSSRNQVVGWHGEALKVKVQAPPEKGKANSAVVAHLAQWLKLPAQAIYLESGRSSTYKVVVIEGIDEGEVNRQIDPISV